MNILNPANLASVFVEQFKNIVSGREQSQNVSVGIAVGDEFLSVEMLNSGLAGDLGRFLEQMSGETRANRFHAAMPTVPRRVVESLADRDGRTSVALIAKNGAGDIKAMAEYAFDVNENLPEVAVMVADEYQHKGVGTALLKMLAPMSIAAGQPVWQAWLMADNVGARKILEKVGVVKTVQSWGAEYCVNVHLYNDSLPPEENHN